MLRYKITPKDLIKKKNRLMWRDSDGSGGSAIVDGDSLFVTFSEKIVMKKGDIVTFSRSFNGMNYLTLESNVLEVIDTNKCKVSIPKRKNVSIIGVADSDDGYKVLVLSDVSGVLPDDLKEKPGYSVSLVDGLGAEHPFTDISCVMKEIGVLNKNLPFDSIDATRLNTKRIAGMVDGIEDFTTCSIVFGDNPFFYVGDSGEVVLWDGVMVTHTNSHIVFKQMIGENEETGLLHEELVNKDLIEDVTGRLIPSVIDMEKVAFEPYEYAWEVPYKELVFNLHFRTRDGSNTSGQYSKEWSIKEGGFWGRANTQELTNLGDTIESLNFTSDDVYYQTEKLQRTFLRLSFYDSPIVTQQQLLYYSTIFLDTGDLYGKYVSGLSEGSDKAMMNVRTSFKVTSKADTTRSSEGFYLYLFPSELDEFGEGVVYMKVDFNHAGYGRTIPMIRPKINFAPISEGVTVSEFYDHLFIPIKIKYYEAIGKYIYFVDPRFVETGTSLTTGINSSAKLEQLTFNLVETLLIDA